MQNYVTSEVRPYIMHRLLHPTPGHTAQEVTAGQHNFAFNFALITLSQGGRSLFRLPTVDSINLSQISQSFSIDLASLVNNLNKYEFNLKFIIFQIYRNGS